jgi:hypothetical protein
VLRAFASQFVEELFHSVGDEKAGEGADGGEDESFSHFRPGYAGQNGEEGATEGACSYGGLIVHCFCFLITRFFLRHYTNYRELHELRLSIYGVCIPNSKEFLFRKKRPAGAVVGKRMWFTVSLQRQSRDEGRALHRCGAGHGFYKSATFTIAREL